jgi:hypothetical protein
MQVSFEAKGPKAAVLDAVAQKIAEAKKDVHPESSNLLDAIEGDVKRMFAHSGPNAIIRVSAGCSITGEITEQAIDIDPSTVVKPKGAPSVAVGKASPKPPVVPGTVPVRTSDDV